MYAVSKYLSWIKKECTTISRGPPPSNGGETPSANPANCLGLRKVTDPTTEEITEPEFVKFRSAQESIPPALCSLARGPRAGTSYWVDVLARQAGNRLLGSLKGLKIRALLKTEPPLSLTATEARIHEV